MMMMMFTKICWGTYNDRSNIYFAPHCSFHNPVKEKKWRRRE